MVPRILLITHVAPGRVNIGRTFLRELCVRYPHDRICCFYVNPLPEYEKSPELDWLPTKFVSAPSEHGYKQFGGRVARWSRPFYERYIELVEIPRLLTQMIQYGKAYSVDLVWATLSSPTVLRLAKSVADSLNLPLVTTVWDPPAFKMRQNHLDPYTLSRLLQTFSITLKASVRSGVASEGMKHRYEQDYNTSCCVMIYTPERPIEVPLYKNLLKKKNIVIGLAGTIYAMEEWNAFLNALEHQNWRIAGREVTLRILSENLPKLTAKPQRVEFLGWRDPVDTFRFLTESDIAYLPYWFDSAYEDVVKLAFPNKLATYVAARLPVLYHGPIQSSPGQFLERFPVGIGCHSLEPDEIIKTLERLVTDSQLFQRAKSACDDAFDQELSPFIFRKRFAELVGIQTKDLLTL